MHDGVTRTDACNNGALCLLLGSRHQRRGRDDRIPGRIDSTTVTSPTT